MNKETLAGKWHQLKGNVKQKWGKLTDNDITQIDGKREALLGKLEARYGYAKERAEKEIQEFEKACGCVAEGRSDKTQERSMGRNREESSSFSQNRGQMGRNQEERNRGNQGGKDFNKRK